MASPIDIAGAKADGALTPLDVDYDASEMTHVENAEGGLRAHCAADAFSTIGAGHLGKTVYTLHTCSVHVPAMHTVGGAAYGCGELHLLHCNTQCGTWDTACKNKAGVLAVAIAVKEGGANAALKPLVDAAGALAGKPGDKVDLADGMDCAALLPACPDYYYYEGGLAVGPFSGNCALWHVMKEPITASKEQLAALAKVGGPKRAVQDAGGRAVTMNK